MEQNMIQMDQAELEEASADPYEQAALDFALEGYLIDQEQSLQTPEEQVPVDEFTRPIAKVMSVDAQCGGHAWCGAAARRGR